MCLIVGILQIEDIVPILDVLYTNFMDTYRNAWESKWHKLVYVFTLCMIDFPWRYTTPFSSIVI